jgi:hypothetical protein
MGRVRVESLGLWTCFVFQTRDKVSLTSYLTPVTQRGFDAPTKNRTKHGHNPVCQAWPRKICEVDPSSLSMFRMYVHVETQDQHGIGVEACWGVHIRSDHVVDEG